MNIPTDTHHSVEVIGKVIKVLAPAKKLPAKASKADGITALYALLLKTPFINGNESRALVALNSILGAPAEETAVGLAHGIKDGSEPAPPAPKEMDMATAAKKASAQKGANANKKKATGKAAPAKKGNAAGQGRVSQFRGKKITVTANENPRRAGSHGAKSWDIVKKNKGKTYEEMLAAGARGTDIAWDIAHGAMKAS